MKVLKQHFYQNRLANLNKIKSKINSNQATLSQIPRYYLEFISIVSLVGFILIMIINGKNINEIIAIGGVFVVATFRVLPSVNRIIGSLQQIKYYKSSMDLIFRDFQLVDFPLEDYNNQAVIPFHHQLELDNISFSYPNSETYIFKKLNFKLSNGEVVGIIGPSGEGKSTLINLIVGLLCDFEGDFRVDGKKIEKKNLPQWRKQLGYVSQSIYLTDDTIRANIAFGEDSWLGNHGGNDMMFNPSAYAAIKMVGLEDVADNDIARLSGGQRQRAVIGRALASSAEFILLDEPLVGIDRQKYSYQLIIILVQLYYL